MVGAGKGSSHWRHALRGLTAGCQPLPGLTAPCWPQALRGYTKTRARCHCCCLPSLPRWQAAMTRSRLDVFGVCYVVVQPFSSKPRVGSGLPACSQHLSDGLVTPLQENHLPSPAKGLIPSETQQPYPHLQMGLPTALVSFWHGREAPEHRAPNQMGFHCPPSASMMNILLDLLLPQPPPSHPPPSSSCHRVLHCALGGMIHGG